MTKGDFVEIDTADLDPAIDSIIGDGRGGTKKVKPGQGKGKAGHSGVKGQDRRGGRKKTLYIDLDTQALIEQLSQAENIPQADVIAVAVRLLIQAAAHGFDLAAHKTIVYSDKQPWRGSKRILRPDEIHFFSEHTQP